MSPVQQKPILHGRDHCPGGADPIPCLITPPSGGLEEEILAHPCLVAFWKLDEPSGDVAYDSGPDELNLSSGSYDPPSWGQADAPPGDASAGFDDGLGVNNEAAPGVAVPALSGDFSAEIWFYRNTNLGGKLIGQGTVSVSDPGWQLGVNAFNEGTFNAPKVLIGTASGGPGVVEANSAAAISTWYHLATTRTSGLFRLYVNGVEQSATSSATYTSTATHTWIGNDPDGSDEGFDGNLAYAALYDCALSAEEVAAHYEVGIGGAGSDEGKVLVADGLGGSSWDFPLEVTY